MTRVGPHVPGAHGVPVQFEAPLAEWVPLGQSEQLVSDGTVAPRGPYCPATQTRPPLHVSWPGEAVHVPLPQATQTARAAAVAPLGLDDPGGHGEPTQLVDPAVREYVPGVHFGHGELRTPPTDPLVPAGQIEP